MPLKQNPLLNYTPNATGNPLLDMPGMRGKPGENNPLLGGEYPSVYQQPTDAPMPMTFDPAGLVLRSIAQQETGGRYEAVGGIAIRGQGRALGKYQFMPNTLIDLGYGKYLKSRIPDDYNDQAKAQGLASPFLSRPEIQDQAALAHINNLAKGLGIDLNKLTEKDVARIAAAWVGGAGMANAPERWARASVGPGAKATVQDYVNRVVDNARRQAGITSEPAVGAPPQPTGAPPVGVQPPGGTPLHPLDRRLLEGVQGLTAGPAYQFTLKPAGQALLQTAQTLSPTRIPGVKQVWQPVKKYGGQATSLLFKGLDSIATMSLGIPATLLTTFTESKDPLTRKITMAQSYAEMTRMRAATGFSAGFTAKGGPFWEKAKQILPNYTKIVEDALWDNFFGTGLGSLKVGGLMAEYLLPPELKKSQAAKWSLGFGLAVAGDPLNILTPAKVAKVSGVTRLAKTLTPKVDELLYGSEASRVLTQIFKRYPDMAGGVIDPVMARSAQLAYHAEYANSVRKYEGVLDDVIKTFGRNPEAQKFISDYVDAGNVGARHAVLTKATAQGIKPQDVARIGDKMVQAGDDMGQYLLAKGFITPEDYNKLRGRYLRIIYDRYLQPDEFAAKLRRMNVPEEWMPHIQETRLRQRLAKPLLYKRPLLQDSNINALMYQVFAQPDKTLPEWIQMVEGFVAKDKNWSKSHYVMRQKAVESIVDLLTEPQQIGQKGKGFLILPAQSPAQLVSPKGVTMEPWQIKSTAERRLMGSAELAAKIEGELGENILKMPHVRIQGLKRQMRLFTARKNIPQEIKEALGEVEEAGPRFAQQLNVFAKQRAIQENLEYISRNVVRTKSQLDLISPNLVASGRWKPIVGNAEDLGPLFRDVAKGEEVYYAPWVFHNFMNDLRRAPRYARAGREAFSHDFMGYVETVTSGMKRLLVTHRPGGIIRNMLSTVIMGDMATGGKFFSDPSVLHWAAKEWTGKGPFFTELSKYADLGADSMKIHEFGLLANLVRKSKPQDKWIEKLENVARHFWDDPVKLYGFTEGTVRLGVAKKMHTNMVAKLGRTLTEKEWRLIAEESMNATINYGDVPYWIEQSRRIGFMPITSFITFPWKVVPRTFKTIWESPTTILKYPRAVEAFSRAQMSEQGYENLASLSPEWMRNNLLVMMPNGEAYNLGWIMPWQALDEFTKVATTTTNPLAPRDQSIISNLFLTWYGELYYNRDFLGRPIVDPNDNRLEAARKISAYTNDRLGGITDAIKMTEALNETFKRHPDVKTDRYGTPLPDIGDIILQFFGFRPYKMEPSALRTQRLMALKMEINAFKDAAFRRHNQFASKYGKDEKLWPEDIQREWASYLERTRRNSLRRQQEAQYIQDIPIQEIWGR